MSSTRRRVARRVADIINYSATAGIRPVTGGIIKELTLNASRIRGWLTSGFSFLVVTGPYPARFLLISRMPPQRRLQF